MVTSISHACGGSTELTTFEISPPDDDDFLSGIGPAGTNFETPPAAFLTPSQAVSFLTSHAASHRVPFEPPIPISYQRRRIEPRRRPPSPPLTMGPVQPQRRGFARSLMEDFTDFIPSSSRGHTYRRMQPPSAIPEGRIPGRPRSRNIFADGLPRLAPPPENRQQAGAVSAFTMLPGLRNQSSSPDLPSTSRRPMVPFPRRRRALSPPGQPDPHFARRKHVYRDKLYSRHVGSNPISRFQDPTPSNFNSNPELVSRARTWIRRELRVFDELLADNIGFEASFPCLPDTDPPIPAYMGTIGSQEALILHISSILKTVDIRGSRGLAEELLGEYIGLENARLFLHELHSWLRSPYSHLEEWDRHVQYGSNPEIEYLRWRELDLDECAADVEADAGLGFGRLTRRRSRDSYEQDVWDDDDMPDISLLRPRSNSRRLFKRQERNNRTDPRPEGGMSERRTLDTPFHHEAEASEDETPTTVAGPSMNTSVRSRIEQAQGAVEDLRARLERERVERMERRNLLRSLSEAPQNDLPPHGAPER